jgi:hypothetical protein
MSYMRMDDLWLRVTAKTAPVGSNETHGCPATSRKPWQLGLRRSHSRTVSSLADEMKTSSTGDISIELTLRSI